MQDALWVLTLLAALCVGVGLGVGLFATHVAHKSFSLPDSTDMGLILFIITFIVLGIDLGVWLAYNSNVK